jgi:glycosyltransferase involved in cell wall biosynthesis
MRILFLTDNFPPEVNAPASRTFEHCREWVSAGHEVIVITCAPNFPAGRVFDGYRNRLWQTERMDGIEVIRVWSFITGNEGFLLRVIDYISFMVTSFIASLFVRRVDVIIGTSPQFFTACAAHMVGFVKRRPWIFELRDIWPESIRAVSAMKDGMLLKLLEKLELHLYRKAFAVVSVTNAFKANLIARGIDGDKIHVVTNGVDTARFKPMAKDPDLVSRLGLEGKFVAGYIGTHGLAHGLDTLVEAAALLNRVPERNRIHILMLGGGAQRERLKASAEAKGLTNITFLDSVSKDEVVRYWSLLDTSIVHLKRDELFKTVIPSKIFECMGMGIPILHGVEGESAGIVQDEGVGIGFEPENAEELVEKLRLLAEDEGLRRRLAEAGPSAARRYRRSYLAERMLAIVERVARRDSAA